jgi:superfamily II DNA or RNA helicase
MSKQAAYGRTWWGGQWLQALTRIDHENRLPRGRAYANRGAVLRLSVEAGKIDARVQGSRAQPYVVRIEVPPLRAADATRLVDRLAADAGLIARLLNRELDPAVLEAAQALEIAIFPTRWNDLGMHCSCPDWAVPCKHLAAVVYTLSREIDGDPFRVFTLRGLDLPARLRERGVHLGGTDATSLPDWPTLLFGAPAHAPADAGSQENAGPPQVFLRPLGGPGRATPGPGGYTQENAGPPQVFLTPLGGPGRATSGPGGCSSGPPPGETSAETSDDGTSTEPAQAPEVDPTAAWAGVDFTTVPALLDPIWRVLPPQPVFHHQGDFREAARRTMTALAGRARLELEAAPDETLVPPQGRLRLEIDDAGRWRAHGVPALPDSREEEAPQDQADRAADALPALLDLLGQLAPEHLHELDAGLAALHHLRLLALHLLARGAVVPAVGAFDAHTTGLLWRPAELDPAVAALVQRSADALPPGLVQRRASSAQSASPAGPVTPTGMAAGSSAAAPPPAGTTAPRPRGRPRKTAAPTLPPGSPGSPGPAVEAGHTGTDTELTPLQQARLMLGSMLGHLVQRLGQEPTRTAAGADHRDSQAGTPRRSGAVPARRAMPARPAHRGPDDDPVQALFFGTLRARFDGPGEGTVPGSIQAWLARLQLERAAWMPALKLDAQGAKHLLSIHAVDTGAALAEPVPLAQVLGESAWAGRRMELLRKVAVLADFHPPIHEYVRTGAQRPMALAADTLPDFLFDALPALRLLGIRTLLPRGMDRLLRPRLALQVKAPPDAQAGSGLLGEASLFSYEWQVAVGDTPLSREEFERLLGQAGSVVQLKGQYVYVDPAAIGRLQERLLRPAALSGTELLRAALAGEIDGAPVHPDAAARAVLEDLRREEAVALPTGLDATLRPYQARGYAWLWRNARMRLGSVIADDMGLGKTLQVIALVARLKEDGELAAGKVLVVVPTSLLGNWQKELARFAPGLTVGVFHGTARKLSPQRPDLLLSTYGVVRSNGAALRALPWRLVVIDEAQAIKNPGSAQTRAVKAIPADSRVAMSGTPVENRLSEYWSIMDYAQPGFLGGVTHFGREYGTPIQIHRDAAAAERLRRTLAPFVLRRLKTDRSIIDDLPDKLEQDEYCSLSPTQAALYESVLQEALKSIAGESDAFQRQGLVLQMILALKQVCNHPAQYLKQGAAEPNASGKVERLLDLLEAVCAAQEKALVFTQFREMGDLLQRLIAQRLGREPLWLHGGVARTRRDALVERFQGDRLERVFLVSLKAGGTGLNLTAASHVVHFDLWWNPAVEAQATDRAYRIGQQHKVQVHRFITRGTFEERINEMIRRKRDLAELTVGSGETWVGQLPDDALRSLFALG